MAGSKQQITLKGAMANQFTSIIEQILTKDEEKNVIQNQLIEKQEQIAEKFYKRLAEFDVAVEGTNKDDLEKLRGRYYTNDYESEKFKKYEVIEQAILDMQLEEEKVTKESKAKIEKIDAELNKKIENSVQTIKNFQEKLKTQIKEKEEAIKNVEEKIKALKESDEKRKAKNEVANNTNEINELEDELQILTGAKDTAQMRLDISQEFITKFGTIEALRGLIVQKEEKEEENIKNNYLYDEPKKEYGYFDDYLRGSEGRQDVETVKEEPEQPVVEEPEQPVVEEPAQPVVEEPAQPVVEEPEQPVVEEPAQPVVEEPAQPVVEETAQPVVEEPAQPVVEEPVVEQPVVEQPVVEQPVVEQPVVEQPVVEQPVVEEPVAQSPETSQRGGFEDIFGEFNNAIGQQETEEPVAEQPNENQAPIKRLFFWISAEGSMMHISRDSGYESAKEKTRLGKKNLGDIEAGIDKQLLETAKAKGDKYVIREILSKLEGKEREEQLAKYVKLLDGEYTQGSPFNITYSLKLRDLKKSLPTKEDRDELIKHAKKIRDLNKKIEQETGEVGALGSVDVSLGIKAMWLWQDSKIGKWFNKNLLARGKDDSEREEQGGVQENGQGQEQDQDQQTPGVEYDRLGNRITRTEEEVARDDAEASERSQATPTLEETSLDDDELPF